MPIADRHAYALRRYYRRFGRHYHAVLELAPDAQRFALGLLLLSLIHISVYVLIGALGAPVFAGFASGVGALVSTTGGYILGFIVTGLIYWLVTARAGGSWMARALGMALGLIGCYAFGTAWFMLLYAKTTGPIGLGTALGWCVIPFIIPDLCKLALGLALAERIRRHVHI